MQRRDFLRGAGLVALGGLVLPASGLAGPTAPPPPGFSSNLNYYIYGGGQPIQGLKVTLEFTDALHAPTGINMQLNAYAGAGDHAVYQQYCMGLSPRDPTKLGWSNENFPSPDWRWTLHQRGVHDCGPQVVNPVEKANCKGDIFNVNTDKVGVFPAMDNEIPAGAKLTWELIDGPDGKVVGAIYSCDAGGVSHSSQQQLIDTFPYDGVSQQHVGLDSMSPIYAFQMNIVALNGGRHADFGGGAGRIIYEAQTPLRPRLGPARPRRLQDPHRGNLERDVRDPAAGAVHAAGPGLRHALLSERRRLQPGAQGLRIHPRHPAAAGRPRGLRGLAHRL